MKNYMGAAFGTLCGPSSAKIAARNHRAGKRTAPLATLWAESGVPKATLETRGAPKMAPKPPCRLQNGSLDR